MADGSIELKNDVHRIAFIRWVFKQCMQSEPSDTDCTRAVFVTSYRGAYGIAGYVITINGSPPYATILIEPSTPLMLLRSLGGRIQKGDGYGSPSPSDRCKKHRLFAEMLVFLKGWGLFKIDHIGAGIERYELGEDGLPRYIPIPWKGSL